MQTIGYGDRVKIKGHGGGREATVINVKGNNDVVIQMGTQSFTVSSDMVTVMSRSHIDQNGKVMEYKLQEGDSVKLAYPRPPADPDTRQPVKYGELIKFISEKRALVRWVGASEDKIERVSRLKWVPIIPAWFARLHNVEVNIVDEMDDLNNINYNDDYEDDTESVDSYYDDSTAEIDYVEIVDHYQSHMDSYDGMDWED